MEKLLENLSQRQIADLMKDTITYLYSKEGRSKNYISKLLKIDNRILTEKIQEWKLEKSKSKSYLTPSQKKNLNKHFATIKSMLDSDAPITNIVKATGIRKEILVNGYFVQDKKLKEAYEQSLKRAAKKKENKLRQKAELTGKKFIFDNYPDEIWKPILGFDGYECSNYGRVKKYDKTYRAYHLISPYGSHDKNSSLFIRLIPKDKKQKILKLDRIIAHTFCDGWSEDADYVEHIDKDKTNNKSDNLRWVKLMDSEEHLKIIAKRVKYKDKFIFKDITEFARFLGTNTRKAAKFINENDEAIWIV